MLGVLFNLALPLVFLDRLEAQVVIGAALVSMMLMTILTGVYGFTRLVGIGHIPWIPLLYFLWMWLDRIPANDLFGIWVRALMVYNASSLIIDFVDVIRYIAGEREETVQGL